MNPKPAKGKKIKSEQKSMALKIKKRNLTKPNIDFSKRLIKLINSNKTEQGKKGGKGQFFIIRNQRMEHQNLELSKSIL